MQREQEIKTRAPKIVKKDRQALKSVDEYVASHERSLITLLARKHPDLIQQLAQKQRPLDKT